MSDQVLPPEFLCNISFLLQACGPDPDGEAAEVDAAAHVSERVESWLRQLAPDGLPQCEVEGCRLPATEWDANRRRCPYHGD